jgi:hypothetical protein
MHKEEIINLWKSVGWNTLNDYHEYLKSTDDRLVLDDLDPDKINPKEFWKASDEHFYTDPVCNHSNLTESRLSIREANKLNYKIPLYIGMIGQTEGCIADLKYKMGYVSFGEIGCGYGSFFDNFVNNEKYEHIDYRGFDIIPRTVSTVEIEGVDGCFSEQQVEKYTEKFNLFFSSNTFQHLSKKQVEKYLTQAYNMLPYGGYFNVMYVDAESSYHYGQKVELFDLDNFQKIVKDTGYSIIGSCTLQIPNSLTPHSFVLRK